MGKPIIRKDGIYSESELNQDEANMIETIHKQDFRLHGKNNININHHFQLAQKHQCIYSTSLMDINFSEQASAAEPSMCVFPQPGDPYNRIFNGILKGACAKIFQNFEANSIIWY